MVKERICAVCGREVSYQDIRKGIAYTLDGVVKHTNLDCKDDIGLEELKCFIHNTINLKFLYQKTNGEKVYSCPQCEKWWKIKQIRPWFDPDERRRY